MPNRVLRDGILTSERVDALSERAEIFYRRLMSVVDDYGRFHANPTLLRSACYPLKVDSVKDDSIKKHLAEASGAGLIVLYTVGGKEYLEIQDFGQRVQSKSKYPEPQYSESTVGHGESRKKTVRNGDPPFSTALVGVVVEDVDEGGSPPRKRGGRTPKRPMPDDFGISSRVRKWAEAKGYSRLEAHFEAFVSKAKANGYAYADWDEAFMGAVRDDWAKLRVPKAGEQPERQRVDL